ncbi:MAG: MoxR family ATPase [Acidobacteriota bacterium]
MSESETAEIAEKLMSVLDAFVLGQRETAESLLCAYMAGGHALIQGVPGIGKTLLARSFASSLGAPFSRLQFTPDLMPSDVTGTNVFDQTAGTFRLVRGPAFTRILMADEINRTPPKTQSALLEAMQERQVTIDGVSHPLDPDFFVIATLNPVEFEGTYPLPEAQLDRFLLRIEMGLPDRNAETTLYRNAAKNELPGWNDPSKLPQPVLTTDQARALRRASRSTHVAESLTDYLMSLTSAVRASAHVELGVSPRGALSLLETARAAAILAGRDFVTPDDIKRFIVPCWGHRLVLTAEAELEGQTPRRLLEDVSSKVEVPKQ